MMCLGILWNSVACYKDAILQDISQHGIITDVVDLPLQEHYEDFVRKVYAQDNIADWKVDKKIETMFLSSDERKVTVLLIDIPTVETFYHPHKKREVFVSLEKLKKEIREKYGSMIPVYFFDNVFHMTDDELELKNDLIVVNDFLKRVDKGAKVLKLG